MEYRNLVQDLVQRGYLKTPNIIRAFEAINRADFLPENMARLAGIDDALPIGEGQTISQPSTVAFMLELLQPRQGDKILDIGCGSGWSTALLAECTGETGRVIGVGRIPELCEFGKSNIAKYNFIEKDRVKVICADASRGLANEAPFGGMIASAAARSIPEIWKDQLKTGGRLVAPVQNSVWLIIKKSEKEFEEYEFPGFVFVPLIT